MQEESAPNPPVRRTNTQRSEEMKARLMAAAREIFVESGFAEASTPDIVKRAQVTRGALYHHFKDKTALFEAVVAVETLQLAEDITARTTEVPDPRVSLRLGTEAYFASMGVPGRAQLLLVDGPAILGPSEMSRLHAAGGRSTLVGGLTRARPDLPAEDINAIAVSLSAAYDRAAFAISEGEAPEPYVRALTGLVLSAMQT